VNNRFVILPEAALLALRQYWATHRNPSLLFPAGLTPAEQHSARVHMDRRGPQKSFTTIARQCGIHKHVSIHSLRHCYGTHLIEAGLNLRAIQQEMGHQSPTTTALYTRLTDSVQQQSALFINRMVDQLKGLLPESKSAQRRVTTEV
jgi:site-specific recombinase XerD